MPAVRLRLPFVLLLLFAVCVAGCREDGEIKIAKLTFNGVSQVDKGALTNALATKQGSRLPWGKKAFFDRRAFDADLQRIRAFYLDRGFPDARVSSFDVQLNDTQTEVRVTVNISEGEPVRVETVTLTGFDVLNAGQLRSLQDSLPLQPGQPLDRQLAVATRERALNALRDEGYPYATVGMRPEDVGPKSQRITLTADPGVLAHFGAVDVRGEASVGEHVILRQLSFKPGDRFTRRAMRDSQRKLYGLDLFEFANVESLEERDVMLEEVPVRITVAEGKHRKLTTGLGYGSEEKARARIRWDHVNFFGGARQAGAEARWSSLDRGVRVDLNEPYLFSSNLSLRLDGQAWQAQEPVYSLERLGGRATVRYQPNAQNWFSVALINQYEQSSIMDEALTDLTVRNNLISLGLDPRDGETRGTIGSLAFEASRNTTNNLLDARRGYVITGRVEQAGRFLWGTYNFLAANVEGRQYVTLGQSMVWANRLNISAVAAQGGEDSNVPFQRRLFAGGATSIRGWGRFEVSPLSGFGFPIGGLTLIEGSSEARFPVWDKLGAVAFVDFGNVSPEEWDFDLGNLRYAVGPGLRYQTPVGPARIDLGYQINPIDNLLVGGEPQKRRWRVHFSIGQAF